MIYDFKNPVEVAMAQEYMNKLIDKGSMCEVLDKRGKRTSPQNRYMHLILALFGKEVGYTLEEVKQDIFKRTVCREHFLKLGTKAIFRSTSDLNTKEMTKAIDQFREFSFNTMGIYLPEANEEENLRSLEHELRMSGYKYT